MWSTAALCCAANLSLEADAAMFTRAAGHGDTFAIGKNGRGHGVDACIVSTVGVWCSDVSHCFLSQVAVTDPFLGGEGYIWAAWSGMECESR